MSGRHPGRSGRAEAGPGRTISCGRALALGWGPPPPQGPFPGGVLGDSALSFSHCCFGGARLTSNKSLWALSGGGVLSPAPAGFLYFRRGLWSQILLQLELSSAPSLIQHCGPLGVWGTSQRCASCFPVTNTLLPLPWHSLAARPSLLSLTGASGLQCVCQCPPIVTRSIYLCCVCL